LGGFGEGSFLGLQTEALSDLTSEAVFQKPEMEQARINDYGHNWRNLDAKLVALRVATPSQRTPSFHRRNVSKLTEFPDSQRLLVGLKALFPNAKTSIGGNAQELGVTAWSNPNAKRLTGIRRALELARNKIEAEKLREEGMTKIKQAIQMITRKMNSSMMGQICRVVLIFRCDPVKVNFKPSVRGLLVEATTAFIRIIGVAEDNYLDTVGVALNTGLLEVSGVSLSVTAADCLEEIISAARPYLPSAQPAKTRESLTESEIKRVEKLSLSKPLPEGWFYDGSVYVDMEGNRCSHRPDLEDLVQEFITTENRRS